MQQTNELSPKQQDALAALLAGISITDVARQAQVDRATVHRWLADAVFTDALAAGRRQLAERAMSRLQALADAAVDVIAGLMESSRETIRIRAALAVLDHNLKWIELDDIVRRLDALEEKQ